MENKIIEAVKTDCGKLKYTVRLEQDNKHHFEIYINNQNEICFESNRFRDFDSYPIFNINKEGHRVAKEIFLTYLQAEVKTRLLELKQLELVLDELGLKKVIRQTIIDNSSMLLNTKEEIIKESIDNTNKLIDKRLDEVEETIGEVVEEKIEENIRPIARKKKKGNSND